MYNILHALAKLLHLLFHCCHLRTNALSHSTRRIAVESVAECVADEVAKCGLLVEAALLQLRTSLIKMRLDGLHCNE